MLNLWEKNLIFPSELIRQLFEVHQFNVNTDELSAAGKSILEKWIWLNKNFYFSCNFKRQTEW